MLAAYERLESTGIASPEEIVLWAHWARLDSRLGEILSRHLATHFRQLNPTRLWEENRNSAMPQVLAALLEFVQKGIQVSDSPANADAFKQWSAAVRWEVRPAPRQMFHIRDGTPNPVRDQEIQEGSLRPFLRWGFYGNDSPLGSKWKVKGTSLSRMARTAILRQLALEKKVVTVREYMDACQMRVHARAAERDLREAKFLVARGNTRGRRYVLKKSSDPI